MTLFLLLTPSVATLSRRYFLYKKNIVIIENISYKWLLVGCLRENVWLIRLIYIAVPDSTK